MTLNEYYLRLEAHELQRNEKREDMALQAWFNQTVQATTGKKNPKPKYKKFDKFFDRESKDEEIRARFEYDFEPTRPQEHRNTNNIFAERLEEFNKLKAEGKIIPLEERRKK